MPSAPQPKLLFDEIVGMMADLFDLHCRPSDLPNFRVQQIRRKIDELAKTDRIASDVARAALLTLTYEYEAARVCLQNVEANGDHLRFLQGMARLESNFLYGRAAFLAIRSNFEAGAELSTPALFESSTAVGAFRLICHAVDRANEEKRVMTGSALIPLARKAAPVLDHFGVSDADVSACVEEAGTVLRARKVLWLNSRPDVFIAGLDADEPGISIEYRVPLSVSDAAEMNSELASALVENDLIKPGFTLGFIGVGT